MQKQAWESSCLQVHGILKNLFSKKYKKISIMQKYKTTSLIHWKSCFGKDKIFHRKKNAFYEHAICLELCFNVLINILKFSTLISNTVSISYNPHEWHLSGSSKYFSNVRRSRDQIFKKLLLNEDPTQPKIIFFKLQKKKNCCWKWKGCVSLICDPYI